MKTGNLLLIGGGLGLAGAGIYFKKLYDSAKLLQPDIVSVGVPKVYGLSIVLPIQAQLRNPTQTNITIDYPSIKIYDKDGSVLGTTAPKEGKLTIKAGSDTKFAADLKIGLPDLAALAIGKFKDIKDNGLKGQVIKMDVMTGIFGFPISFLGYEKKF